MDVNVMRIAVTVLSFICFVVIWVWAWKASNRARFDELARVCVELDAPAEGRRDAVKQKHPSAPVRHAGAPYLTVIQGGAHE